MENVDYKNRRKNFLKRLGKKIAVLPSSRTFYRNSDVAFPYRQESNFFYLTGFEEPKSICLYSPSSKQPFQMFVQEKDKTKELWEGKICGPDDAKRRYGADLALPSQPESHFDEAFVNAVLESDGVYYRVGYDHDFDRRIFGLLERASKKMGRKGIPLWPIFDPLEPIGEMRLFKDKFEIERMTLAAAISAEAHVSAMKMAKPGMYEFEMEAILHHAFRAGGANRVAYGSIVASGQNACVLHYVSNQSRLKDGELLLIDAGAEFEYYAADITRVFPINGSFTQAQRDIYSLVLLAQKEAIRLARPSKTLQEIHSVAVEVLTEGLRRLKILSGSTASLIKQKKYFTYYPHNTSHWLGMDVHDVGKYYENTYLVNRKLKPGMVFTIEPGLYFSDSSPAKYRGIGIRIEDDILITHDGHKILTSGAPKEIDEIESICSGRT